MELEAPVVLAVEAEAADIMAMAETEATTVAAEAEAEAEATVEMAEMAALEAEAAVACSVMVVTLQRFLIEKAEAAAAELFQEKTLVIVLAATEATAVFIFCILRRKRHEIQNS